MERKAPAFQLYVDDFLGGTMHMSAEEVGVYIRLLCCQWSHGPLSDRHIRACGGDTEAGRFVVDEKFIKTDAGYINQRLENVRNLKEIRKEAASKGGSKTQANRQAKLEAKGQAKLEQTVEQTGVAKLKSPTPSPTPSPSSVPTPVPSPVPSPNLFGEVEASASPSFDAFLREWNCVMGQSCVSTDKRKKAFKARIAKRDWAADWRSALAKAGESDFCRGLGDRGWVADPDWFLRPDTVATLMEGKYDNRDKDGYYLTDARKKLHNSEVAAQDFLSNMGSLANLNEGA